MRWTITDSTVATEPIITECIADAVTVQEHGILRFFTVADNRTVMLHRLCEGHTVSPES